MINLLDDAVTIGKALKAAAGGADEIVDAVNILMKPGVSGTALSHTDDIIKAISKGEELAPVLAKYAGNTDEISLAAQKLLSAGPKFETALLNLSTRQKFINKFTNALKSGKEIDLDVMYKSLGMDRAGVDTGGQFRKIAEEALNNRDKLKVGAGLDRAAVTKRAEAISKGRSHTDELGDWLAAERQTAGQVVSPDVAAKSKAALQAEFAAAAPAAPKAAASPTAAAAAATPAPAAAPAAGPATRSWVARHPVKTTAIGATGVFVAGAVLSPSEDGKESTSVDPKKQEEMLAKFRDAAGSNPLETSYAGNGGALSNKFWTATSDDFYAAQHYAYDGKPPQEAPLKPYYINWSP